MRIVNYKINKFAKLTGYIHEPMGEMPNITEYPAILVIPGGGFRACSERESEPVAMAYFAEGFQAFTLVYTNVTSKPDATIDDPIHDAQNALRWIRENAKDLYVADHKLAMIGFSGGAHLASAVATRKGEKPDALLLGYPGIIHSDLRALDCPDIAESVDETTPPSFIFSTRADKVTPPKHPLAFAAALDAHDIDFELHIFRSGDHGMSLAKPLTCSGEKDQINAIFAQWFKMSMDWLWQMFGEFTIYGVNDGRSGEFSIDCRVKDILANEEAAELLKTLAPGLVEQIPPYFMDWITLRKVRSMMPGAACMVTEELDEALLGVKARLPFL